MVPRRRRRGNRRKRDDAKMDKTGCPTRRDAMAETNADSRFDQIQMPIKTLLGQLLKVLV
jgi:hypothetical protein